MFLNKLNVIDILVLLTDAFCKFTCFCSLSIPIHSLSKWKSGLQINPIFRFFFSNVFQHAKKTFRFSENNILW